MATQPSDAKLRRCLPPHCFNFRRVPFSPPEPKRTNAQQPNHTPYLEGSGSHGLFWKYFGDADSDTRTGSGTCWALERHTMALLSTCTGEWSNNVTTATFPALRLHQVVANSTGKRA